MSGRYLLPDGIGVPYHYGFVRESRLFDGRCEYTPLAPVGGYYEPVGDTQYPTLPEALAALADHLGDEDLKHRLKGELA